MSENENDTFQPTVNNEEREQTNEIIVRAQTENEEFEYLMGVLSKMDFYNQHGYKISIPEHPFFEDIYKNHNLLESIDIEVARDIFANEIYKSDFFHNGLEAVSQDVELIKETIKTMGVWKKWGFKIFPEYEVKLTAYGTGGSYDSDKGNIIMKTKETGYFGRSPQHTIIHEIVHIGIEESIIKNFELTHIEKEGLVDSICANCFGNLMIDYKVQTLGNKIFGDEEIFELISKDVIDKLPSIIEDYKKYKN